MWAYEGVMYQIYPLGFCNAPKRNDGQQGDRLTHVLDWIAYLKELGITAVVLNPLFESDAHGYDTRDFVKVDVRLGDEILLQQICDALHKQGIHVLFDGVFNHVGRGFFAFLDVLEKKQKSIYKDWFYTDFSKNNNYDDGFYYEGWEGHYELVKLNLSNEQVIHYIFSSIQHWINTYQLDGLRLDVAYCLDKEFLKKLRTYVNSQKEEFFLFGEMLFGDYKQIVNDSMLDSATNYECYKGIYSSFNDKNLFEIAHSLNRQFAKEPWTLYQDLHLVSFVDNHDVSRIATILQDKNHIALVYAILFGMNGIPCLYYGSEWGTLGDKNDGDDALRAYFKEPVKNELWQQVKELIRIRKEQVALQYGSYKNLWVRNEQLVFQREYKGKIVIIAINLSENEVQWRIDSPCNIMYDLITKQEVDMQQEVSMKGYSYRYFANE